MFEGLPNKLQNSPRGRVGLLIGSLVATVNDSNAIAPHRWEHSTLENKSWGGEGNSPKGSTLETLLHIHTFT